MCLQCKKNVEEKKENAKRKNCENRWKKKKKKIKLNFEKSSHSYSVCQCSIENKNCYKICMWMDFIQKEYNFQEFVNEFIVYIAFAEQSYSTGLDFFRENHKIW